MTLPLHDVRVLDLSDHRAALGSTNAGRPRRRGHDGRAAGRKLHPPQPRPILDDQPSPERSYQHLYFNVNKRSVTLDWRAPDGFEQLQTLAAAADILIEAHQPGEFPVNLLREANPHLIVVSASPYGQRGPKAHWRATDLTATAAGGLLQVSGEAADPPMHGAAHPPAR